ncbi:MAG TPA: IS66 family transposase [Lacipirellulaceae bacterium]
MDRPLDLAACRQLIRQLELQNAALTAERESFAAECQSVATERAALRLERESLARELDRQRRHTDEQRRVLDDTAASYDELRRERDELQQQRDALRHELALLRQYVFGRRRERHLEAAGQQHLFELFAPAAAPVLTEAQASEEELAPRRRRRRRSRSVDLDGLPQHRIEHDVPEEDKQCQTCGCAMTQIGTDETRVLQYQPATLHVEVHVLPKYACSCCKDRVVSPPVPPRPIPRSIASPGLIAWILVSKFGDHLPLYRQEDILTRHGVHIPRSTLCDWVQGAAGVLQPLYDLQKQRVLSSPIVWTDDTPVRLLDPEAEGGSRLARFWTYIGDEQHPYSVYDFTPGRSRDGPHEFLANYAGYLQADAYGGYDGIYVGSDGRVMEVACGAHLRRKFVDARGAAPRDCAQMLEWFRQLYDIEDRARELSAEDRCALRQSEAVPVLARMRSSLDELAERALPRSSLGKAVTYACNQWEAFVRYTTDGRLTIDNNVSERTLRAQAIGRKNWLFVGHEQAGPRAAVLFTILAGAKRHRLEPWAYVSDVLLRLTVGEPDLESLLPDRWAATHPEHVLSYRLEESRQRRSRKQARRAERRRARP